MNKIIDMWNYPDAKGIAVCGDIHGDFNGLVYKCCIQYGMTGTLIVVAGDCGFGFEQPDYYETIYQRNQQRLLKANKNVLCGDKRTKEC